ncbi:hypothetical protein [Alloalcanivorax venustensis]|uniref:hypothetical protein n=1 Tax=Alloalcanivorax venustensis TaxID=172371 RepID=UPI00189139BB|nr:hypothetical protein [Alloalcanivorax venustensis]
MTIFVSYTTRDYYVDRELLQAIPEVLSGCGDFYIDLLHNDSVDKQGHVVLMLSKAKMLLLISSGSIKKSKWVQWELKQARIMRIPVISVQASPNREQTLASLKSHVVFACESLTVQSTRAQLSCADG